MDANRSVSLVELRARQQARCAPGRRARAGVVPLAVAVALLAAGAALALPQPGTYAGTTGQGKSFSVTVNASGNISGWSVGFDCPSHSGTSSVTTTCTPSGESFSCGSAVCSPFAALTSIAGSFDGNDVSGTVKIRSQPGLTSGCCALDLPFTAMAPFTCPEHTLCLVDDRFLVDVEFRTQAGQSGMAEALPLSNLSGTFYFFNPDNREFLVKVINGCSINDRYWVFFAATTNVEYTLTVTDTEAGTSKQYTNPLGTPAAPVQDTSAFATCP